jgi:hypothetical protein
VTLWALFLAALGIILCVVGANASLGAKFGDQPGLPATRTRSAKLTAATGRLAVRTGLVLVVIGGGLFVLGIVIHTIQFVLTILFFVVIVVAVLSAWGHLRRTQSR